MTHYDPRNLEANQSREAVEHGHHHPTLRTFIGVWIALLVATGLTVWVASINLGVWSPVVALVIATIKALLVILFFMEIKYQTKMTMTVVIAAFFFLGILLVWTMLDYISRAWSAWGV